MDKYAIDYKTLENGMSKPKSFKYSEVKDRLVKVAYDIVRFMDAGSDDLDGLWQVQTRDDGEVIVAMYESDDEDTLITNSSWDVIPDNHKESMSIFYKGHPVKRVIASEVGVPTEEIPSFCNDVANKLHNNKDFRNLLLDDVSESDKADIFNKYPELTE